MQRSILPFSLTICCTYHSWCSSNQGNHKCFSFHQYPNYHSSAGHRQWCWVCQGGEGKDWEDTAGRGWEIQPALSTCPSLLILLLIIPDISVHWGGLWTRWLLHQNQIGQRPNQTFESEPIMFWCNKASRSLFLTLIWGALPTPVLIPISRCVWDFCMTTEDSTVSLLSYTVLHFQLEIDVNTVQYSLCAASKLKLKLKVRCVIHGGSIANISEVWPSSHALKTNCLFPP